MDIELKDLRIEEEYSLGGLEVAVEKVGDNKKFKPITITKNGTYEGGIEDGKQVGFNPITVNVPLPVEPLTVTENGVYEAEQGKGFNIVNVDVKQDKAAVIKALIKAKNGYADSLFACPSKNIVNQLTDETLAEMIAYDTFEDAISLKDAFANCRKITTIPLSNTSKVIDWGGAFNSMDMLKSLPPYDTSNATNFDHFCFCGLVVEELPLFDTRKVERMNYAFGNFKKIKIFPALDLRSCTTAVSGFIDMQKCEWFGCRNIKTSIDLHYSSRLTQESIIHTIKEYRDTGSALTLNIGATNIKKITGDNAVYVKIIPITDEMRAEDDLIDEKLPFEVCESTDEGAMPITEYALEKNLQIAG